MNKLVKVKELFDARVHLGHHEGCWNQNMKRYIYGTRAHHHVIDLNKTVQHLQVTVQFSFIHQSILNTMLHNYTTPEYLQNTVQ